MKVLISSWAYHFRVTFPSSSQSGPKDTEFWVHHFRVTLTPKLCSMWSKMRLNVVFCKINLNKKRKFPPISVLRHIPEKDTYFLARLRVPNHNSADAHNFLGRPNESKLWWEHKKYSVRTALFWGQPQFLANFPTAVNVPKSWLTRNSEYLEQF